MGEYFVDIPHARPDFHALVLTLADRSSRWRGAHRRRFYSDLPERRQLLN